MQKLTFVFALFACSFLYAQNSIPALEKLGSSEWILKMWDADQPAPDSPAVTIKYAGGRFTGHGGCNNYFAAIKPGKKTDEIVVGPVGSTRMACPEPDSTVEARFMKQLEAVHGFEVADGKLSMMFGAEGATGTMVFEQGAEPPANQAFNCDDGSTLSVVYSKGNPPKADLTIGTGAPVKLTAASSASDAKYSGGDITFWPKTDGALFKKAGKWTKCQRSDEAAAPAPAATEPAPATVPPQTQTNQTHP